MIECQQKKRTQAPNCLFLPSSSLNLRRRRELNENENPRSSSRSHQESKNQRVSKDLDSIVELECHFLTNIFSKFKSSSPRHNNSVKY